MLSRRRFLASTTAALAAAGLPASARAASGADLKFVFVLAYGGWDVTRVFAPEFDNPNVDMELDAGTMSQGGLAWVSHAARPSVDTFRRRHVSRTLILNGLLVPSVGHETCLRLILTGSTAEGRSDWPALLAASQLDAWPLPHLVIDAPSFAGEYGVAVSRTGESGQLDGLLDASVLAWSDQPVSAPTASAQAAIDAFLAARARAVVDAADSARRRELLTAYETVLGRARTLKGLKSDVDFATGIYFSEHARLAVDVLRTGLSRCVTLQHGVYPWDSHTGNDVQQSYNFEDLFARLNELMVSLEGAPGAAGGTLADETLVVVVSEMGRTPQMNVAGGKDHWPYTSALLIGPGIAGNRNIGGFDDGFQALPIDLVSGELDEGGSLPGSDMLGATLLTLAGLDPAEWLPGVATIPALLA
jgi:uncharacterized protein (DUF1501 family)